MRFKPAVAAAILKAAELSRGGRKRASRQRVLPAIICFAWERERQWILSCPNSPSLTIAVIGSGYVGLIAAVCFAEIGHSVICVDNDREKVEALQSGEVPIYEDQLPELLARHRGRGLVFSTDLLAAARKAQVIFIAVGTPQSPTGEADLSYVEAWFARLPPNSTSTRWWWRRARFRCLPTSGSAAPCASTAPGTRTST